MTWCSLGDVGWALGHVWLWVAGAARGGYMLQYGVYGKVPAAFGGEHPDAVSPGGGRALAVGHGESVSLV